MGFLTLHRFVHSLLYMAIKLVRLIFQQIKLIKINYSILIKLPAWIMRYCIFEMLQMISLLKFIVINYFFISLPCSKYFNFYVKFNLNTQLTIQTFRTQQMGNIDSKQIHDIIDQQYNRRRKYFDSIYGQITVIQQKNKSTQYVLKEKVFLQPNKQIKDYLEDSIKMPKPFLLNLFQKYNHPIDMCSISQKQYFIMEYCSHSLSDQINKRQTKNEFFLFNELLKLYHTYAQAIVHLREVSIPLERNRNRNLHISNSSVAYTAYGVKVMDYIFKIDYQNHQLESSNIFFEERAIQTQIYVSPESYLLWCRKEKQRAKQQSLKQSSVIFSLGVNFLQIALLENMLEIYDPTIGQINFQRLANCFQQVLSIYGQQVYQFLSQMMAVNPQQRPSLKQVKQKIRNCFKNHKTQAKQQSSPQSQQLNSARNNKISHNLPPKNPITATNYY